MGFQRIQKAVLPLILAMLFMAGDSPALFHSVAWAQLETDGLKSLLKDHRKRLNRKYKKIKRKRTDYIIVHTSEGGLASTLKTLSSGKKFRGYSTAGGHAHYAIARDGTVYYLLSHEYRADHAGLSMWDGKTDISSCSVGIELVGYHYADITDDQYTALGLLVKELQRVYSVPGKNVLTHCQVSYGNPNQWVKQPHRGRKRCALNFDRARLGLGDQYWAKDPDVDAGRLTQDKSIYAVFYKPHAGEKPLAGDPRTNPANNGTPAVENPADITAASEAVAASDVISKDNTAWNIAGEDYDDPSTLYLLPDQRQIRGDRIAAEIGWDKIPIGTRLLLNQTSETEKPAGPVFPITGDFTAWSYAGKNYNAPTTFYFFRHGGFVSGERVKDWDSLPEGASMIIGYQQPREIGAAQGTTPWSIAGRAYNNPQTIYYFPDNRIMRGDEIENFNDIPKGSYIFVKNR